MRRIVGDLQGLDSTVVKLLEVKIEGHFVVVVVVVAEFVVVVEILQIQA